MHSQEISAQNKRLYPATTYTSHRAGSLSQCPFINTRPVCISIVHSKHALRERYICSRLLCSCARSHPENPVLPIQSGFPIHVVIHITVRAEIVAYRKRELHRRHREITLYQRCRAGSRAARVSRCCRHFKHAGNTAEWSLIWSAHNYTKVSKFDLCPPFRKIIRAAACLLDTFNQTSVELFVSTKILMDI